MSWAVASDTDRLTDVLVCAPDHYRWIPANDVARRSLAAGNAPDARAVRRAHAELVEALQEAGVRVHALPPEPHLPYMAYTRDPAIVLPRGAVLGQLARPERRGEYAPHLGFFDRPWRLSNAGTLEGGDVHLLRDGVAAIGVSGGRTDAAGAAQLAAWLREEGWDVREVPFSEHFLHLDLLFAMAAPGLALAFRDALDAGFLDWLGGHGIRTIDVSYAEAMTLGANMLALGGGRVLGAAGATRINAALRAEGLIVLDPDLTPFTAGGGGARCLTCPLRRVP